MLTLNVLTLFEPTCFPLLAQLSQSQCKLEDYPHIKSSATLAAAGSIDFALRQSAALPCRTVEIRLAI